jgi:hypothetical protein
MATLAQRLQDLGVQLGTDHKLLKTMINGNAADLSALATTIKTNLVAAINEVRQLALDAAAEGGAEINDASTAADAVWSSQKVNDEILAAVTGLATGAPAALNSIDELAAALQDDANVITNLLTAMGNRVRVDAVQAFSAPQKAQARSNIGADVTSAETGNLDQDLVGVYNTAKA